MYRIQYVDTSLVQLDSSVRWYQSGLAISGWLQFGQHVLINSSKISRNCLRHVHGASGGPTTYHSCNFLVILDVFVIGLLSFVVSVSVEVKSLAVDS